MPRRIGDNLRNVFKFKDPISEGFLHIYYRLPTNEEKMQHFLGFEDRAKFSETMFERREESALKIILGFRQGDFEKEVEGKFLPFSSEEGSDLYDPDWKVLLKKGAADVLHTLAYYVFEATLMGTEAYSEKNS